MGDDQEFKALARGQSGSGVTRREFLRQAAVAGIVVGAAGTTLGAACIGSSSTPTATVKRGGTLRVGIGGGGAKDTLDAHGGFGSPDICRKFQLYNTLATFDHKYGLVMELAEEITPTAPDNWVIRLKKGLEWHNGKSVSADDVIFTLQRILDPKTRASGRTGLLAIDLTRLQKVDDLTVRVFLTAPDVGIADQLAQYANPMVPVGYDPANPIGSGPFVLKSFTPGQQSVFTRNPNYWKSGLPYIDSLEIYDFPDETARVNALLSGQVDAIDAVSSAQVAVIQGRSNLHLLKSESGQWVPFTMRVDQPPFNDVRVRQAMRLIVDRPQMVQQALAGYGRIANDLFSPYDPAYTTTLPQRHQDIAQAKSLLKQAGQENLTVNLQTAAFTTGAVEAAQVFAAQAQAANVTVNVQKLDTGTYYGSNYLKYLFALDYYNTRNYLPQVATVTAPTGKFNETHWPDPEDQQYGSLYQQARQTVDPAKRADIIHTMQKMEYDRGGLIVWGFVTLVDAYSSRVTGFVPDSGVRLSRYGFESVSIT